MEELLNVLGGVSVFILIVIGLVAGFVASLIAGGHLVRYLALGVVGALLLPFLLAAVGVTALAAGGLILVLVVAGIGAVILLALGRAIFGGNDKSGRR